MRKLRIRVLLTNHSLLPTQELYFPRRSYEFNAQLLCLQHNEVPEMPYYNERSLLRVYEYWYVVHNLLCFPCRLGAVIQVVSLRTSTASQPICVGVYDFSIVNLRGWLVVIWAKSIRALHAALFGAVNSARLHKTMSCFLSCICVLSQESCVFNFSQTLQFLSTCTRKTEPRNWGC